MALRIMCATCISKYVYVHNIAAAEYMDMMRIYSNMWAYKVICILNIFVYK